jgi:hypothetical protein
LERRQLAVRELAEFGQSQALRVRADWHLLAGHEPPPAPRSGPGRGGVVLHETGAVEAPTQLEIVVGEPVALRRPDQQRESLLASSAIGRNIASRGLLFSAARVRGLRRPQRRERL